MARIITVTSPAKRTDEILQELKSVKGLLELQAFRGVSVSPPGDVIKAMLPNCHLNEVMRLLDKYDLGKEGGISMSTSEPAGAIPTQSSYEIRRDNNEASWEEMELTISNDSNTSPNTLITMFLSGALAAVGIATNAIHIVVGAMMIAPGFMPITRVALGFVGRERTWRYGVNDFLKGYLALIIGAAITAAVLKATGHDPLPGSPSYYSVASTTLMEYWTKVSFVSVLAAVAAGTAGGLLVASRRSVLASGVMVGLALIPSAALIGMSLFVWDLALAQKALFRFVVEVALVFTTSLAVLLSSQFCLHRRKMRA